MADNKYKYPPAPPEGGGTFSDNLVGFQTTDGGGLTQGNFEFSTNVVEKVNRTFNTGVFANPVSLDDLNINSLEDAKKQFIENFRVYPNYDISQVVGFSLYGSIQKRLSSSVTKIVSYFPASIDINYNNLDYTQGPTAINIDYDEEDDLTTFNVDVKKIKNPFDIEYSVNADINMSVKPVEVDEIRNLTRYYKDYSVYITNLEKEYKIYDFVPSDSLYEGYIEVVINGNPFSGEVESNETIIIKPNDSKTDELFKNNFDEIESFLLNREVTPIYTAKFEVLKESSNGELFKSYEKVKWELDGLWNIDIRTKKYDFYLEEVNRIAVDIDDFRTDLISRFLTAGTLKDFDTSEQKFEKLLQIYGRSFDEIKKFIDALSYMNSVNYKVKNDIPSQLLFNLSQTLGWDKNISPINNENFLNSVFTTKGNKQYSGASVNKTPNELNYQFYRNLVLNSAYLFKSKGTRRAIESVLRMVGAPNALIEFNEKVYLVDGPINIDRFNNEYIKITGGTKIEEITVLDNNNLYQISGVTYTGFTTDYRIINIDTVREDYPIDIQGYPTSPQYSDNYFFQKGSGWYESNLQHKSTEQVDITNSTFVGQNPNIQTVLEPFTYGKKYIDRFKKFPYMGLGFNLTKVNDNNKSWVRGGNGSRIKKDGNYVSNYYTPSEKNVLNVKNIDISLNMGQGIIYDIWNMSKKYNYPLSNNVLSTPYPTIGGIDWTNIKPKASKKTFAEFAQTFYKNMINVRNRMYINDGKGGGYPTLQYIYWKYMNSMEEEGIPTNKYTYQKMIDFTKGIGDYWMKIVEQMIPATTLWTGGQKFENNVLHRQKIVWRLERPEQTPVEPCEPYVYNGQIFTYGCLNQYVECDIDITPQTILSESINQTISSDGFAIGDCDLDSVYSNWYIDIRLDSDVLIQELFYEGFGGSDYPTNDFWLTKIEENLSQLNNYGLTYLLADNNGNTQLKVYNLDCLPNFADKTLYVNVGVSINIDCEV